MGNSLQLVQSLFCDCLNSQPFAGTRVSALGKALRRARKHRGVQEGFLSLSGKADALGFTPDVRFGVSLCLKDAITISCLKLSAILFSRGL